MINIPKTNNPFTHLNQINFVKPIICIRFDNVENTDDVFVIEMSQKLNLSQCSEAEHGVIKGSDALDGDPGRSRDMNGGAVKSSSAARSE